MLHTNPAYDSGIQNVLVVSEDEDVIALFLANVDSLNGQLFQISEIQNCQKSLDIKQLRSGISSNIAGLRLISDLKKWTVSKGISDFRGDIDCVRRCEWNMWIVCVSVIWFKGSQCFWFTFQFILC